MPSQPETKNGILGVCGSLVGLTLIAVSMRLCARRWQQLPLMADDVMAIVSLVSFFGASIVVFLMVHNLAIGHDLTPAAGSEFSSKTQIAWDVLSTTSVACTKLSALFFYHRVFCVKNAVNSWFNTAITVLIVIVVLWLITFQFLTGFQCGIHFSALWDGNYVKYCTISGPFLEGLSISDFLLDIIILSLPIPRILQLNTTPGRKLAIIGVFLTSLIGLGAACARMVEYITLVSTGPSYFIYHDEERAVTQGIYFAMLEAGISLIAVNLPTLWFLITSVTPDNVIRSIRSVLSLSSLHSSGRANAGTRPGGESTVAVGRPSQSSAKMASLNHDEESQMELDTFDNTGIHMENTVSVQRT